MVGSFFNYLVRGMYFRRYKRIKLKLKDLVSSNVRDKNRSTGEDEVMNEKQHRFVKQTSDADYNWDKLKRRIKLFGLINPLVIQEVIPEDSTYTEVSKYVVVDGNHRYVALHELYGEDYEVKCKLLPLEWPRSTLTSYISRNTLRFGKWGNNNHRKYNTEHIDKTLTNVHELKSKMNKKEEELRMKLMQRYRMNVRINKKN